MGYSQPVGTISRGQIQASTAYRTVPWQESRAHHRAYKREILTGKIWKSRSRGNPITAATGVRGALDSPSLPLTRWPKRPPRPFEPLGLPRWLSQGAGCAFKPKAQDNDVCQHHSPTASPQGRKNHVILLGTLITLSLSQDSQTRLCNYDHHRVMCFPETSPPCRLTCL